MTEARVVREKSTKCGRIISVELRSKGGKRTWIDLRALIYQNAELLTGLEAYYALDHVIVKQAIY